MGEFYYDANGALRDRCTRYYANGTTDITTDYFNHHSFQNLAQPSAGFLGIGTHQEYQRLKVVASLDMDVHKRIVDYWGETKEFNSVWLPHGRGVMRDNQAKTMTIGWWYEGRLAVQEESTINREANFIRLLKEPEILNHVAVGEDDVQVEN